MRSAPDSLTEKSLSVGPNNGHQTTTRAPFVKGPFGYFGSKQRLASRIVDSLPPHNAWVEVFCGSAAVTLAKPQAPIEVINDIDGQIVNFYRVLRDKPDDLINQIELTPYALAEFEDAKKLKPHLSSLEQARRFLVASMMTVNGAFGSNHSGKNHSGFSYSQSFSRNGQEARVSRWNSLPTRLRKVVERLKTVRIENRDARDLIKMFSDRPASLLYLDPPYLMDRSHGYTIDANEAKFHKELLALACRAKCMVLVSGYENELYDSLLSAAGGWRRKEIETHTRDTSGRDHSRTEVLWENRALTAARDSGRVPIHLSAKERKENKINPKRGHRN